MICALIVFTGTFSGGVQRVFEKFIIEKKCGIDVGARHPHTRRARASDAWRFGVPRGNEPLFSFSVCFLLYLRTIVNDDEFIVNVGDVSTTRVDYRAARTTTTTTTERGVSDDAR